MKRDRSTPLIHSRLRPTTKPQAGTVKIRGRLRAPFSLFWLLIIYCVNDDTRRGTTASVELGSHTSWTEALSPKHKSREHDGERCRPDDKPEYWVVSLSGSDGGEKQESQCESEGAHVVRFPSGPLQGEVPSSGIRRKPA